jgi:hypothetical protein
MHNQTRPSPTTFQSLWRAVARPHALVGDLAVREIGLQILPGDEAGRRAVGARRVVDHVVHLIRQQTRRHGIGSQGRLSTSLGLGRGRVRRRWRLRRRRFLGRFFGRAIPLG